MEAFRVPSIGVNDKLTELASVTLCILYELQMPLKSGASKRFNQVLQSVAGEMLVMARARCT